MRLLVSVRSEEEVEAAISGGADIIDAKEPSEGSLGAVTPPVLAGIMRRVPPEVELSVALGDLFQAGAVRQMIASLPVFPRGAATYVKLGFCGSPSAKRARVLLGAAVSAAREHPLNPQVIAVAYADPVSAESPSAESLLVVAGSTGAAGLLIDTYVKNGRTLLDFAELEFLAELVQKARSAGLITALAGGLGPGDLPVLRKAAPDIVGFRGAACDSGRSGRVRAARVKLLRRAMIGSNSAFAQEPVLPGST